MSFYLARLEAARQQHRMMAAAAAGAGHAHAHAPAPRAWPPLYQHAGLLPRPEHPPPVPPHLPPLHAGSRVDNTWRGGSVARRNDGAPPLRAGAGSLGDGARQGGVAGSATGATAREETGGDGELRNKRPLAPTPRPRSPPPPKRRAVAARRLFPPGCGRDAALLLASADVDASRSVAARGDSGSGAPYKSAPLPAALAGAKVDSVLFEATSSRSAAAPGGSISALEKVSASGGAAGATTDGGHHCQCQGERLVKSSEAVGRNGAAAAADGALMDAADSPGVAGTGSGKLLERKEFLVPSVRLLPKPTTVSANRRFPPGCRRLGAPLPAAEGTANEAVCLPSPEEVAERDDTEFVGRPGIGTAYGAAQNEGWQDGSTTLEVQKPQISSSVTLHGATACVGEDYASHTSSGERIGNRWHCEERSSAVPAIDANVTNRPGSNSCNVVAAGSLAQGLSKECHGSDGVSDCADGLDTTSLDPAAGVSDEGAVVRKKVMHTPRKSVRPPRLIQRSLLNTQLRPSSMEIEREETELGWSVTMNDADEDTGVFTKDRAIQDPISANKCPWTKGKEAAFFGPKKRVNKKKLNKRRVTVKGPTSACALDDKKEDFILEDDEIFKALAAHETKSEYGPQSADARSKVKEMCTRFESICRAIVQAAGHRSVKVRRIDLAADKLIRRLPGFTKQGPVVGSVPGVEVGDEFLYRVQLALVGLHRPFQGGIDATRHDETGVRIAISVVASGGYPDELSCSGELVYTGSGKKDSGDQKLEHGNLALKNCIEMKTPVRVIHGFKDRNREEGSHSRAREISTFTYDGLYHVVDCWREGTPGSKVFKYKLRRIPGQPQLSLHMAKAVVKNSMRPGFVFTCMPIIFLFICFFDHLAIFNYVVNCLKFPFVHILLHFLITCVYPYSCNQWLAFSYSFQFTSSFFFRFIFLWSIYLKDPICVS